MDDIADFERCEKNRERKLPTEEKERDDDLERKKDKETKYRKEIRVKEIAKKEEEEE